MAGNTIGQLFRVTTFGESHGLALGCIVDGVPPGIPLTEADLQHDLDRRRPGTSRYTTQRREPDQVKILSGVFEGVTTGTSIGLLIENTDQRSQDYGAIKDLFRPGPRRLHLRAKVWSARLSWRRSFFCARNRDARSGRGDCQKIPCREVRHRHSRLPDADGRYSAGHQRLGSG